MCGYAEHGFEYIAFYVQKLTTPRAVCYNFPLVSDKPLGVPASLRQVYYGISLHVLAANGTTAEVECGEDGCSTEGSENEACLPIDIPEGDNVFGGVKDCLKFVRSEGVTSDDCTLGKTTEDR